MISITTPIVGVGVLGLGTPLPYSVSSTGTTDIVAPLPFVQNTVFVTVNSEGGAFTHKLTISLTNALTQAILHIRLDFAATADPTVEIYNNTIAGTLLQTITGQADSSTSFILDLVFNGTAWQKLDGRYIVSA